MLVKSHHEENDKLLKEVCWNQDFVDTWEQISEDMEPHVIPILVKELDVNMNQKKYCCLIKLEVFLKNMLPLSLRHLMLG